MENETEELSKVEETIVALVSARDVHILKAVAYSLGEQYTKVLDDIKEEGREQTTYEDGYIAALTDIYSGIVSHINELSEKYNETLSEMKINDHQNETPEEEN